MNFCPPSAASVDAMQEIKQYGVSRESKILGDKLDEINSYMSMPLSLSWKQRLEWNTDEIFVECSLPDWDGYNAAPISEVSFWTMRRLINNLPGNIDEPEVVAEPSGKLALLWQDGNEKIFSLSADENKLVYAGLFGGDVKHGGVTRFTDEINSTIKTLLQVYFPKK